MSAITTFTSDNGGLLSLLEKVRDLKVQLPDFQRGWIWDDDHVRSLIASISLSYPVGAVMMLEAQNSSVRFRIRPVEGVATSREVEPDWLILDGQQRLTSLYLALMSGIAVPTKDSRNVPISRWYYIDMVLALDPDGDRDDAVVSVPLDRTVKSFRGQVRADYSTDDREYANHMFPVRLLANSMEWRQGYQAYWNYDREYIERWNAFERSVIKRFEQYLIPIILLSADTPKEAVCQVFEKVNTGGVALTVFELLTATFAADNFSLRDDWEERRRLLRSQRLLQGADSTELLQVVALLSTMERRRDAVANGAAPDRAPVVACKRREILNVRLEEYQRHAPRAVVGYIAAARLLQGQKVFAGRDIPYRTQLVPLAAVLAELGSTGEREGVRQKLVRWFWCGVFGELYGSASETRFARDLPEVLAWIAGGTEPSTVTEALFSQDRLVALRSRQSAAYKGVSALLLRDGGLDLMSGDSVEVQTYFDESMDVHHVFPKKWCDANAVPPARRDSIINKTPLSARTNRSIGGDAPSIYLPRVEHRAEVDAARMNEMLRTHRMDPVALRSDDFESFWAARLASLTERVEAAMAKQVVRTTRWEGDEAPYSLQEEEEQEERAE